MITIDRIREVALSFPGTTEEPHFEKTSFRVKKKIFATYDQQNNRACIKLSPIDQDVFSSSANGIIYPVDNKWGKQGWTFIELEKVNAELFKDALKSAYCLVAPNKLVNLVRPVVSNPIEIELRQTEVSDLDQLFVFQLDEEAIYQAAFTPKDQKDKSSYLLKYTKLLDDPSVNMKTILANSDIVGSISKFELDGKAEITYWIDKKHWGKGIATKALTDFLTLEKTRPIFGRVVFDNFGSQKVLQKCGFRKIGTDKGFANARQAESEEFIYKLI